MLDGFALQGNESTAWQAATGAVDTLVAAAWLCAKPTRQSTVY